MSVLVTGGATPLGEALVRRLVADVRLEHVLVTGRPGVEFPLAHPTRLSFVPLDLARPRRVHDVLFGPARDLGVQVVVHLGHPADPYRGGRRAHEADVEALRAILDLSDRHPTIRRVVVASHAVVYKVGLDLPILVTEDHPLDLDPRAPQYVRDRVEADLTACARMGLADCEIVVLRCAEALAPGCGSQLYDFLAAPVALRPWGFDPMVNVATLDDLTDALSRATFGSGEGVFNVPGADTLPLTEAIRRWGTPGLPALGPLIRRAYDLRHRLTGSQFSYGMSRRRMHLGLVLDGTRAARELGYAPRVGVDWPVPR
jgi:UDP-glucose 4-epimerase